MVAAAFAQAWLVAGLFAMFLVWLSWHVILQAGQSTAALLTSATAETS